MPQKQLERGRRVEENKCQECSVLGDLRKDRNWKHRRLLERVNRSRSHIHQNISVLELKLAKQSTLLHKLSGVTDTKEGCVKEAQAACLWLQQQTCFRGRPGGAQITH